MRDAIIEKLRKQMAEEPKSEADVVYALVQIRKVLEHRRQKEEYSTLAFFCDWVAHTKLTGGGAQKVLKTLEDRLGRYDPKRPETLDPDGKLFGVLSLRSFQQELHKFCEREGLPISWADGWRGWQQLVLLYAEIIRDAPLVVTPKRSGLTYLLSFELENLEPPKAMVKANPGSKHFGLNWKLKLSDGRSFNFPHAQSLID